MPTTLKISSCTVELLDGTDVIVEVDKFQESSELIDEVYNKLDLKENGYFGLRYEHQKDGKMSWFDVNKPLQRQVKKASNKFRLAVRFYPPSLQMLHDEITRYQFVLQIRENLLTGVWSCSIPTQALLASYIIQAELGDYNVEEHNTDYLKGVEFVLNQDESFAEKVHLFHKKHIGLSSVDAEWMYLETARKIPLYGMDAFDIMDADGNSMRLAVNINGIHILNMNTVLHSFIWPSVSKVHQHGHELLVDLEYFSGGELQEMSVSFLCSSKSDRKRILRTCKSYEEFSYHGKPKAVPVKSRSKSFRHKKAKQPVVTKCSHVANEKPPSDFKRVDSARFSKRVLKKKDDKIEQIEPSEKKGKKKNDKSGKKKSSEQIIDTVPIITETLASDPENHDDSKESNPAEELKHEPNNDRMNQQTPPSIHAEFNGSANVEVVDGHNDDAVVDDDEDDDEPVEVSIDDLPKDDEHQVSKQYNEITDADEIEVVTNTEEKEQEQQHQEQNEDGEHIIDADELVEEDDDEEDEDGDDEEVDPAETSSYNVEEDTELVIIEFQDIEELCQTKDKEEEKQTSLLDEIDKELRASQEKV